MNVMRFTAKDNRTALAQVRETLGPDALILANRRTASGVEICATAELPDFGKASATKESAPASRAKAGGSASTNELTLAQLKRELAGLRATLQQALGDRKWQDSAGKRPVLATVEQRLGTLGIGRELAGHLTTGLAPDLDLNQSWAATLQVLLSRIDCMTSTEIEGLRIKAVIGSPGSGKTAAVDALMTAALGRLEAQDLAVITFAGSALTDPLAVRCEAAGIRYLSVSDRKSLSKALSQSAWAREVLIDTRGLNIGKGSQDPVLAALSGQRAGWAALLMVPATAQRDYLLRLGEHVAGLPIAGALLSKLDHAVSVGPALDLIVANQLPVAGQLDTDAGRIASVSAEELIQRAKQLARSTLQRQAKQLKVAI